MEKKTFTLIKDKYSEARDGKSAFLNLYCDHCGEFILLYQKDGSGPLKRMYFDRIIAPTDYSQYQNSKTMNKIPNINCRSCRRLIAVPGMYDKEDRRVYFLLSYAVIAKPSKGDFPPIVSKIQV